MINTTTNQTKKGGVFIMVCRNCGRKLPETATQCKFCGWLVEYDEYVEVTEEEDVPENQKGSLKKTLESIVVFICVAVVLIAWLGKKHNETDLYKQIYGQAVNEVTSHISGNNLKVARYRKKNVQPQSWEVHDFGAGPLRYQRFAVTVPVEYDALVGHMKIAPNINVYYYTSNQNISGEYLNTSVKDHFYTPDIYEGWWE